MNLNAYRVTEKTEILNNYVIPWKDTIVISMIKIRSKNAKNRVKSVKIIKIIVYLA